MKILEGYSCLLRQFLQDSYQKLLEAVTQVLDFHTAVTFFDQEEQIIT
jgi:hypothetical protein